MSLTILLNQPNISFSLRLVGCLSALLLIAGCSITPKPITQAEQKELQDLDKANTYKDVETVGITMTLSEAVARGLKYNLDYRAKMME